MKIDYNGIIRDMTSEEEQASLQQETLVPTSEERLQALESAMLDMILGG